MNERGLNTKHLHTHEFDCESYQFNSDTIICKSRSKSEKKDLNFTEKE